MPQVLNRRSGSAQVLMPGKATTVVYVGRPSPGGNYGRGMAGPRADLNLRQNALLVHLLSLDAAPVARLVSLLEELKGFDLECWCAPKPCHADTLLALANQLPAPAWMNEEMLAAFHRIRDKVNVVITGQSN